MNVEEKSIMLSYRIACAAAIVSVAFSVIVGMLMFSSYLAVKVASPLDMSVLEQLRAELKVNPADDALKNKIREFDYVSRKLYFAGLKSMRTGSFLLLGGLVIAFISLKTVVALRKKFPDPREYTVSRDKIQSAAEARLITGGMAVVLITGAAVVGVMERQGSIDEQAQKGQSGQPGKIVVTVQPAGPALPAAEFLTNWPSFRGPSGCGTAPYKNLPVTWGTKSGVVWRVPVPLPGMSSPVVWGNRVFVTGATEKEREVYCYETEKGTLLWRMGVNAGTASTGGVHKVNKDTGYAAPTCVTDGRIVYSIFANGNVAAIDFCAQKMWTVDLGLPLNKYGFSSSPLLCDGRMIVQFDSGGEDGKVSQLLALDTVTGKKVWSAARPVTDSWPSPILIDTGKGRQIVTMANEFVISHDPESGKEIWRVKCQGSDVAPSPIYAGGLVIATVTADLILAIRPDGQGDVTKTNVVWKSEDGVADVPSPVSHGELLFFAHSGGTVTCLDVKTGKIVWDKSLDAEFYSSPTLSGDCIYLVSRGGEVFVFKAGPKYEELGRAKLGEPSDCSPAFMDGRIYLRGATNLFCIGN